ncbi:MAG: Asp-tRNA(Asn)/Glu-tRNA(Gln) amidotransferase subunit GatB [Pseudomonadota bacterium]
MQWETVIGLEIHVQLSTKSKLFSGSSTAFGSDANTQANVVDLALPGILPVPNKDAFKYAIMFGLAVNAEINKRSVFDRKNYFYPDSPKGYQTTQLDLPVVGKGYIDIHVGEDNIKRVRIHHAHLEEDAGKSLHENFQGQTGIDLNRAGTPLIEIVTEPDMRNAKEAVECFRKLHTIVTYLGICDGDLSQGSMRCDANVSIRPLGEDTLGTRAEIKNINSFKFVEKAINVEVQRQINALEDGDTLTQETRLYDSEKNETRSMRSKEEANDYRYFPCPDLLPVEIDDAFIDDIKASMPELPEQKKQRFIEQYALSDYDAEQLTNSKAMAEYFENVCKVCSDPKLSANWILGELLATLNKNDIDSRDMSNCPVSEQSLGQLILRITDNTISSKIAKKVFSLLWGTEQDVDSIIEEQGFSQVSDSSAIETMVQTVINNNPQQVEQFKAADEAKRKKMVGFFVGQVMKASQGQANPAMVNDILIKLIG